MSEIGTKPVSFGFQTVSEIRTIWQPNQTCLVQNTIWDVYCKAQVKLMSNSNLVALRPRASNSGLKYSGDRNDLSRFSPSGIVLFANYQKFTLMQVPSPRRNVLNNDIFDLSFPILDQKAKS